MEKTLSHAGLSLSRRVYSEAERQRLARARELVGRNVRYKDLAVRLAEVCLDLDVAVSQDDLWQFQKMS